VQAGGAGQEAFIDAVGSRPTTAAVQGVLASAAVPDDGVNDMVFDPEAAAGFADDMSAAAQQLLGLLGPHKKPRKGLPAAATLVRRSVAALISLCGDPSAGECMCLHALPPEVIL
jgi:hypothetical protein